MRINLRKEKFPRIMVKYQIQYKNMSIMVIRWYKNIMEHDDGIQGPGSLNLCPPKTFLTNFQKKKNIFAYAY